MDPKSKEDLDNHANQLNDNNDAYYQSRGYDDKEDFEEQQKAIDDDNDSAEGVYWSEDY